MVTVSSCCCCCSLRTGTLVIGWLGILAVVLNIVTISMQFSKLDHLDDMVEKINPDCSEQKECMDRVRAVVIGGYWTSIAIALITLPVFSLLLYAVYKSRPRFMIPYFVYTIVVGILMIVPTVAAIVYLAAVPVAAAGVVVFMVVQCALHVYFMLVVWSYRKEVMASQRLSPMQLQQKEQEDKLCQ